MPVHGWWNFPLFIGFHKFVLLQLYSTIYLIHWLISSSWRRCEFQSIFILSWLLPLRCCEIFETSVSPLGCFLQLSRIFLPCQQLLMTITSQLPLLVGDITFVVDLLKSLYYILICEKLLRWTREDDWNIPRSIKRFYSFLFRALVKWNIFDSAMMSFRIVVCESSAFCATWKFYWNKSALKTLSRSQTKGFARNLILFLILTKKV